MNPFDPRLVQPDQRTCGPAVLVLARMLSDPDYADRVTDPEVWAAKVWAVHRRVTGTFDARGRAQLPWPPALGTPPWAVAREMEAITGLSHRPRPVLPWQRDAALDDIRAAATGGHLVPLYVGNRWLPRHVVLLLDADLSVWDPARGRRTTLTPDAIVDARLALSGWTHPWFSVLPT